MNVGQAFQSAGAGNFPVARSGEHRTGKSGEATQKSRSVSTSCTQTSMSLENVVAKITSVFILAFASFALVFRGFNCIFPPPVFALKTLIL